MAKTTPKAKFEKVQMQGNFSKDKSFSIMFICFMLITICAGLVGSLYFFWLTRPTPTYFATTPQQQFFVMEPLDRPYLNERQLYQWVVEAAVASYTFDFVNFQNDIETTKIYYTENGFKNLINALKESNTIEEVRSKKLVASAVPLGAPILLSEGRNNGRYFWKVQLPMKVTYQGASEIIPQNLVITMTISRVPVEEKAKGIGIETIVVREGRIQP